MLFYRRNPNPRKAAALREVVEFGVTDGQKMSEALGYIPLPDDVVARVRAAARSIE